MTAAAPPCTPAAAGIVPIGGGTLAAVRPGEEGADAARIFEELRSLSGIGVVPLLYRVLATDPDALSWCWDVLAPAFRQGLVAMAAQAAAGPLSGRRHPRLPATAGAVLGLSSADLAEARAVVAGFNRANPQNLAALSLLEQGLREGAIAELPAADPVPVPGPLPELGLPHRLPLDPQALPPQQAALVEWLSTRGGQEATTITPTLWRCLAHWPPLLALAATVLEPLHAGGAVEEAAGAIRRSVVAALRSRPGTPSTLRSVAAPAPEQAGHIQRTIAVFGGKIPEMILSGHVLAHLLDEA